MKKTMLFIFILSMLMLNTFGLEIRLGSVAPKGSPWVKALNQIASDWRDLSGGQIRLRIYPGGIVGDENEMLRKMKLRQLDAAAMTIAGMNQISKGVMAMATPMMARDYDQLMYMINKLGPRFEQQMEEERFVVLAWIFIGWTYFFSKEPLANPQDLADRKLWVIKSNQSELQSWKNAGTTPVALSVQDVLLALQSGKIDTFYTTMTTAAAFQWFGLSKHMLNMHWAPMIAGLVVSKTTWDKVPVQYKVELTAAARKAGEQVSRESLDVDAQALATMKEYGLNVHSIGDEDRAKWKSLMETHFDLIIDEEFGREAYELVKKTMESYEKQRK